MTQKRAAEYPRPNHILAHFTDPHFIGENAELLHNIVPVREKLERFLDDLVATDVWPEALIFTGDLADRGDTEAYRALRSVVEPVVERIGAELIWVMGNHDNRANMRTALLDEPADDAPYDRVVMLGGLRIIVLDTTVPGKGWGEVRPEQHEWLTEVLATPAPEGTILAMHHAPIPCVQDFPVTVELRDQPALAETLTGTDVRSIIGGHIHYSTFATFAGIPVAVSAATAYAQDLLTPERGTRGRDSSQGFHLIHVYDFTIMHTAVRERAGGTVGKHIDGPTAQRLLDEHNYFIPDAPGRHVPETEVAQ